MQKPLEKGMLVCWNAGSNHTRYEDKQLGTTHIGHAVTKGQMFYIKEIREGKLILEFFENRNLTLGWTDAKNVIPFKAAKKLVVV